MMVGHCPKPLTKSTFVRLAYVKMQSQTAVVDLEASSTVTLSTLQPKYIYVVDAVVTDIFKKLEG